MTERQKKYLTRSQVALRYGVVPRSIMRWENDPNLGFPDGVEINGRWFFDEAELERWEQSRAVPKKEAA